MMILLSSSDGAEVSLDPQARTVQRPKEAARPYPLTQHVGHALFEELTRAGMGDSPWKILVRCGDAPPIEISREAPSPNPTFLLSSPSLDGPTAWDTLPRALYEAAIHLVPSLA